MNAKPGTIGRKIFPQTLDHKMEPNSISFLKYLRKLKRGNSAGNLLKKQNRHISLFKAVLLYLHYPIILFIP